MKLFLSRRDFWRARDDEKLADAREANAEKEEEANKTHAFRNENILL
jgi:hypothetical protein